MYCYELPGRKRVKEEEKEALEKEVKEERVKKEVKEEVVKKEVKEEAINGEVRNEKRLYIHEYCTVSRKGDEKPLEGLEYVRKFMEGQD